MNYTKKKVRTRIEPPAPKDCIIVEVATDKQVYIEGKEVVYSDKSYPSKQLAQKALRPIIKKLPKRLMDEPKKYIIRDL